MDDVCVCVCVCVCCSYFNNGTDLSIKTLTFRLRCTFIDTETQQQPLYHVPLSMCGQRHSLWMCHWNVFYSLSLKHFSFLLASEVTRENFDSIERVIIETVRTNFPETWIWDLVSIE